MSKSFVERFASRPLLLAPMAGVADPVFRGICKRMGAAWTYSEMISAQGLAHASAKTEDLLLMTEEEKPAAVQLFGREPEVMAAQARALEERYGADLLCVDINMGCPARKIASKGEGAALMREPAQAARVLAAVVAAVRLPVTVKFRKGFELGEDAAVDFALMAEASGAAAVAVHGRYARQMYRGESDREIIARVKEAISIPVIASGDVFTSADIQHYREDCGADAVMIARGVRGNPWLFAGIEPTLEERVRVAGEHAALLARLLPYRLASMRRHIAWYFKGTPHAAAIRREAERCVTLADFEALLVRIRDGACS
jgi:nifR3 family TIM-barrel protein